ncbi:MAG: hypothetical protein ABI947_26715 [Chloroflexota bacterium]
MNRTHVSSQVLGELYVRPVVAPDNDPLGWAVCVMIENVPASTVDKQARVDTPQAELLILRHCADKGEAFSAKQTLLNLLRTEKRMVAKLAHPKEFWEWNASTQVDSAEIVWTVLEGDELTAFRADQYPLRCKREAWHPEQ